LYDLRALTVAVFSNVTVSDNWAKC